MRRNFWTTGVAPSFSLISCKKLVTHPMELTCLFQRVCSCNDSNAVIPINYGAFVPFTTKSLSLHSRVSNCIFTEKDPMIGITFPEKSLKVVVTSERGT